MVAELSIIYRERELCQYDRDGGGFFKELGSYWYPKKSASSCVWWAEAQNRKKAFGCF